MLKAIKKYLLLPVVVLALVCSVVFAACGDNGGTGNGNGDGDGGDTHTCEHVCPDCHKCLTDCEEDECAEKCDCPDGEEEHECEHVCPDCHKCLTDCEEDECAEKCDCPVGGEEHECEHVCPDCHKCLTDCEEDECEEKCEGHDPDTPQTYPLSVEAPCVNAYIGYDEEMATTFTLTGVQAGDYIVTLSDSLLISSTPVYVIVGEEEPVTFDFNIEELTLTANITITDEESIKIYADFAMRATVTLEVDDGTSPIPDSIVLNQPSQTTATAANFPDSANSVDMYGMDLSSCGFTGNTLTVQVGLSQGNYSTGNSFSVYFKINGKWIKQDNITANNGYTASRAYTVDVSTVTAVAVVFDTLNVTKPTTKLQFQIRFA